METTDYTDYMF